MIKKFIISNCIKIIRSYYPNYNEEEIEKIQYGLEAIYLSTTKLVVILLLSIIFGFFMETIIVLLLFNVLRTTGFGLHATKSWMCWVTSLPTFVGVPLLCKYSVFSEQILISIALISLICFIFFAPADTVKRPLIRQKRRIIYKILTIILGIVYTTLVIVLENPFWKSAFALTMLIEAVLICPLTYKMFKLPYNNYKRYKP